MPQYLPSSTLLAGVKAGSLHQGHFNANQYNYLEGSVAVPGFSKPVLLIGRQNMNRSVNGDIVVVEVFDESEWKAPADEVVDQEGTSSVSFLSLCADNILAALKDDDAEGSDEDGENDREIALNNESKLVQVEKRGDEKQPTGRVVGIIKRNWRAYV